MAFGNPTALLANRSSDWRDFLKQKNPIAAALMSKMRIEKGDRPKAKAECLRLMVTLKLNPAKMQLISGFVDSYLRLNSQEELVFQSELNTMELQEREQIMQITTSWEEEGEIKGQVATILRQLKRKFGTLESDITKRIESLKPSQLDSLTEDLLDFQSKDDLLDWLDRI